MEAELNVKLNGQLKAARQHIDVNLVTVPGYADVLGIAVSTNEVAINGDTSNYRRGDYFHKALAISNSGTNPAVAWTTVTANNTTKEGKLLLPPATQEFRHDADGNLTNDFVWCYVWNGENRLIQMDSVTGLASTNRLRLVFEYDWQGRRIRKTVTRLDTSAVILDNKFLYDGWNLIAELNATNNTVIRSYLWGTDLSGTMQGAGGVGGLLAVHSTLNSQPSTYFPSFDGNGNVAAYLKSDASGTNWVRYEYGPFAESIRISGTVANPASVSPFRFSTKYQDEETDSLYYGHRYLKDGRWLSRDPLEEEGGRNLYGFVANNPVTAFDLLGLYTYLLFVGDPVTADGGWVPFFDAAKVKSDEIKNRPDFLPKCDTVKIVNVRKFKDVQAALTKNKKIKEIYFFAHAARGVAYLDMTSTAAETNVSRDGGPLKVQSGGYTLLGWRIFPKYNILQTVSLTGFTTSNTIKSGSLYFYGCNSTEIASALGNHFFGRPGSGISGTCYFPVYQGKRYPVGKWDYILLLLAEAGEVLPAY